MTTFSLSHNAPRRLWGSLWLTGILAGLLPLFWTSSSLVAQEQTDDDSAVIDFFGEDVTEVSPEAEGDKDASETPKETSGKKKEGGGLGLLGGIFGSKEKDDGRSEYRTPIETVLPSNSLMILRTSPIKRLNDNSRSLIKGLGFGDLSPLTWLSLSPYGKSVNQLDQSRPVGVCWLVSNRHPEPATAIFLPIRRFVPFVRALGAKVDSSLTDADVPEGTIFDLKTPSNWIAFQLRGYAILLKKEDESSVKTILSARPVGAGLFSPSGLEEPDFSLKITSTGIRLSAMLRESAGPEFHYFLRNVLRELEKSDVDLDLNPGALHFQLNQFSDWMVENVNELVLDGKIIDSGLVTSSVFVPVPGSKLAGQIRNSGGPRTPTLLNQPGFLKVLPPAPSPLTGQTDLFPEFAAPLDPPFNRVRHIEYSFNLPERGELLAESWAFFLEVDDTDAFVRELIIPKAKLIGSHMGSDQAGQMIGEFLGNLSAQRQGRGRRPLLFNSPEEAAMIGRAIGAGLGSEIGSNLGEKEAMKTYDFDGYKLYISDLVLYTQQMREIQARERGESGPPPIFVTGEPSARILIAKLLAGLQTGSLDDLLHSQLDPGGKPDDAPLLARRNLILILDKTHLLIVPGNERILREAVRNWRGFLRRKGEGIDERDLSSPEPWREERDEIYRVMADPSSQILRGAFLFDLGAAQALSEMVRADYAPGMKPLLTTPVPRDLSRPFFLSTNAPNAGYFYGVYYNDFLKFLLQAIQESKSANGGGFQNGAK